MINFFKSIIFHIYLGIGIALNVIQIFARLNLEADISELSLIVVSGLLFIFFWTTTTISAMYFFLLLYKKLYGVYKSRGRNQQG